MAGDCTFQAPKSIAMIARILGELQRRHMTRDELQCLLRVSKPTARRYVDYLRSEPKCPYVKRWATTGGQLAPVYAVGTSPDAARPAPFDKHKHNVNKWKRIKSNRDLHARHLSAERVRTKIQRLRGKPQPWFAALIGAA